MTASALRSVVAVLIFALAGPAYGQGNGRLQLHFINVGQGDAALLVSPRGETVLFDNGVYGQCTPPRSYLDQLGLTGVDYHIASHYHRDHIGCSLEVLGAGAFPVRRAAYDRGGSYNDVAYDRYIQAVGGLRQTAQPGGRITLDQNTPNPVTITFQVVNGLDANGVQAPTSSENDFSVVAVVRFGMFDAVMGGDLSGANTSSYRNVEARVAAGVGPVEVYKANHHGSRNSTNATWLGALTPVVAIISAGVGNSHGHPNAEVMTRLHQANVRTYWTTNGSGNVQAQNGLDVVGDDIVVEVVPGATTFSVTYTGGLPHTYAMIGAPPVNGTGGTGGTVAAYAWSTKSQIYHHAQCRYVDNISAANLGRGNAPPAGKQLHQNCPVQGANP